MKNLLFGVAFAALAPGTLSAQDIIRYFELSWPLYKVNSSLYNSIDFIDSRAYKAAIGTVTEGLTPTQEEKIVWKTPISPQLTGLLRALTDNTARDGVVVFQLKRFRFIERSGIRYCYLAAALYARKSDRYYPLSRLNTVIPLHTHIWKTLQSRASDLLADFLSRGLLVPAPDSISYSREEVEHIDSLEKKSIPLYSSSGHYIDGLYRNPRAFLYQQPDWTDFAVELRSDGSAGTVKAAYTGGEQRVVGADKLYALVYKGQPYIMTESGAYPLQRLGDDFYFTCPLRKDAGEGDLPGLSLAGQGPSLMSGITGATLMHGGLPSRYQLILDHETGGFVFIRALDNSQ